MPLAAPKSSNDRISVMRSGAPTGAGSSRHEPAANQKTAMPNRKSSSPSRSLTSGIWGSQLATTNPFTKNTRDTDIRARRSTAADAASLDKALAGRRDRAREIGRITRVAAAAEYRSPIPRLGEEQSRSGRLSHQDSFGVGLPPLIFMQVPAGK